MGLDEGEHASTAVRGFDHGEKLDVHLRRFVGEEGNVNLSKAISRDHLRLHLYYGYLKHPCYLCLQSDQSYTPEVFSGRGRLHVESS